MPAVIWLLSRCREDARFLLPGLVCLGLATTSPSARAQVTGSARTALAIVEDIRARRPIVDVGPDDVVVQEDADSREILSVRPADYPVVLMIDSGASPDELEFIRKTVQRFVERLGSERPVAVGAFDDRARILAGFDADRRELIKQLNELAAPSSAVRSVHQAMQLATETLASTGALFSSIVILSAGPSDDRDNGSSSVEGQDATASVVASGAILHVIVNRANRATHPAGPGTAAILRWSGDDALRTLTEQSRGQFITIYTPASFEAALDQLAARMTSELMIEYLVPNQSRAGDVKLGVRVPGAQVRGLGVR